MPRRGIAVGDVDELADRVLAVAGHRCRHPLGDGRDLPSDDQAAIVVAGHVRLDHDVARPALGERPVERRADGLLGAQVEVDAAAVVAVERLDHAREAEALRDGDGLVLRGRPRRRAGPADPAESRSRFVRLLSEATSTPIAEVCEVIVARMRCWWMPWPNWTSE